MQNTFTSNSSDNLLVIDHEQEEAPPEITFTVLDLARGVPTLKRALLERGGEHYMKDPGWKINMLFAVIEEMATHILFDAHNTEGGESASGAVPPESNHPPAEEHAGNIVGGHG